MSESIDGEQEELVGQSPEKKNWKGICIALFIIMAIISLVVFAVILVSPRSGSKLMGVIAGAFQVNYTTLGTDQEEPKPNLTISDVLEYEFGVQQRRYQWLRESRLAYFDDDQNLVAYSANRNDTAVLMRNTTLAFTPSATIVDWKISADEQFILLKYGAKKVNRYSTLAEYYITGLGSNSAFPTGTPPSGPSLPQDLLKFFNDRSQLRFAVWSPTESKIAFHADNMLYFVESPFKTVPIRIYKPENDKIYAGVPDWLYEVDILKADNAIWWSPDSRFLLFAMFNDTSVPSFSVPYYSHEDIYSCQQQINYPKAGHKDAVTHNPTFEIFIVDTIVEQGKSPRLERVFPSPATPAGDALTTGCAYLSSVTWINSSSVLVTCQNRLQNHSTIFRYQFAHPTAWRGIQVPFTLAQKAPAKGAWLPRLSFANFGQATFMVWPSMAHRQAYRQIFLLPKALRTAFAIGGSDLAPILQACGKFDVEEIVHFDMANNLLYFVAAADNETNSDTRMRNLFAVNVFVSNPSYQECSSVICISCKFNCLYGRGDFALPPSSTEENQLIFYHCEGPIDVDSPLYGQPHRLPIGVPFSAIYELIPVNQTVEIRHVKTIQNNDELRELFANRSMPAVEWHKIELNRTESDPDLEQTAWARLLYSSKINPKHIFSFPMLLIADNEPQTRVNTLQFKMTLEYFLSAAMGVVSVRIDGRGTSGQGLAFEQAVYKRLGYYELQDQVKAVEYFQNTYSFVDKRKTAVFGFDYGGYLATKLVVGEQTTVRCSIAVAPIVQWRLHYSSFTERYLGPWLENTDAYYDASVRIGDSKEIANNLNKHQLFVIHGLSDDTVHFQHTALLADQLRDKHALYHFQALPNLDHTLGQHLAVMRKKMHETVIEQLTDCYHVIPAYQTARRKAKKMFKQQMNPKKYDE